MRGVGEGGLSSCEQAEGWCAGWNPQLAAGDLGHCWPLLQEARPTA